MIRTHNAFSHTVLGIGVTLLAACRPSTAVVKPPEAPRTEAVSPERTLSRQNVDAVIYQNASAEVHRLYQQGYALARVRLDANLERPHALPPAVIVDIDETVLDNSPSNAEDAAMGRTFSPAEWKRWTAMAKAKALPGAVDFLNHAVGKGCAVFYITNREMDEKEATMKNLIAEGFPMVDEAHVMPMAGTSDKTERRAEVAKGHFIALLVGDQLTDFDQSLKDRSVEDGKYRVDALRDTLDRYFILLPNAMYGVWLNAVAGPDTAKLDNKERFLQEHGY